MSGDFWRIVHDRVDVEGDEVAAAQVFGIVLRVISADTTADVVVPRDALAKIQEDRPGGVGGERKQLVSSLVVRRWSLADQLNAGRLGFWRTITDRTTKFRFAA